MHTENPQHGISRRAIEHIDEIKSNNYAVYAVGL
jgi:hypothetical protein